MSLIEQLNQDIKAAMKKRDKETLSVLRMLKAAVQNAAIDKQSDLSQEEEVTIMSRELKQRQDSKREFEQASREDLIEKVQFEIEIVKQYLPQQLSVEEVKAELERLVDELGITSKKEFGKLMGEATKQMKGQAEGSVIRDIAMELLN
ncbi:GatB/YqeY domain-containing protein [Atopobacter phocae]|uniref:GatB/YqeY domain-containing protein n=1 Tax=Atopobacter phocae TaxID=136492 RepID=UPI00046E5E06|nr:GatB/YqeY domain-containing protein [Atopobacter phocae]